MRQGPDETFRGRRTITAFLQTCFPADVGKEDSRIFVISKQKRYEKETDERRHPHYRNVHSHIPGVRAAQYHESLKKIKLCA